MFYLLAAMLLVGCYEVRQGQFVAEQVPGWSKTQADGGTYFRYPTKSTPRWFVFIGGDKKGKLHVWIGSDSYDPYAIWKSLGFTGKPIRIKFIDQNKEADIPAKGFQTLFGQDLDLGDSQDFIVIVPSFKIGDNLVPELSAHFRWSNEKYRVVERLN
jgi:hypothetical protein